MGLLLYLWHHWQIVGLMVLALTALIGACVAFGPAELIKHDTLVLHIVAGLVVGLVIVCLDYSLKKTEAALALAEANYQLVLTQNKELSASNANLLEQTRLQSAAVALVASDARAAASASKQALADANAKQQGDVAAIAALQKRIADPKNNTGSCDDEIGRLRSSL